MMGETKVQLPKAPKATSKSIYISQDLIGAVEAAIAGTNGTFSAFVVEAVRVALEDLKEAAESR